MTSWLDASILFVVSIFAGATAAIAGFGIGSLLTPLLALRFGTGVAVALVSVPHAVATVLRAWRLRGAVDWAVFRHFGIASAAGGIAGALLHGRLDEVVLRSVLGMVLMGTAISAVRRPTPPLERPLLRPVALAFGGLSGFLGGLVGNQGGVRAGALLGLQLSPAAFVATSTMSALVIDAVRTPAYVARFGSVLLAEWELLVTMSAGAVLGTLGGARVLVRMAPDTFRRLVALVVALLGLSLLASVVLR